MIAVDQVGNLGGTRNAYVQGGDATDGGGGYAAFLSEVMLELSGSGDAGGYGARASSVSSQDDGTSCVRQHIVVPATSPIFLRFWKDFVKDDDVPLVWGRRAPASQNST
jgi:hypothetical protein